MTSAESDDDIPLAKCRETNQPGGDQQLDTTPIFPPLHEDIIVSILQWLPVKKLIQLECVSRHWKDKVIRRAFAQAKIQSINLSQLAPWPTTWRRSSLNPFKKLLDRMGSHLTSVSLNHHAGVQVCKRISHEELPLLMAKCPNLKHLEVDSGTCVAFLPQLPSTVDSIRITADTCHRGFEADHLEEFLRTHPGLKQFGLLARHSVPDLPQWLAQYCTGLVHLSLYMYIFKHDRWRTNFADMFRSLTQLKELELSITKGFDAADLTDLCVICTDLEFLMLNYVAPGGFTLAEARLIGQLKKLRRLELRQCLTDECVVALCEAVGATLEFFQLRPNWLTDGSLRAIGLHCHNLVELRFDHADMFTLEGMANLIETITSHPSWNDPAKNRYLRIKVYSTSRFDQIDLDPYEGRVAFANW